jgi:hypothetical protein
VGFDVIYSMLFTGPSGLPVLICDCLPVNVIRAKREGPETGWFYERELVA